MTKPKVIKSKFYCYIALRLQVFVFLLALLTSSAFGAEVPLDSLVSEVTELKSIATSIQGSLITSVRLIQDQLDQLGKTHLARLDDRLSSLEAKVTRFEAALERVDARSSAWDTFQHHLESWQALMNSVDSKVDHLGMAQSEGNANSAALLNSLQTNLGLGVAQIADRIEALEKKVPKGGSDPTSEFTARGVLTTLQVRPITCIRR